MDNLIIKRKSKCVSADKETKKRELTREKLGGSTHWEWLGTYFFEKFKS